MTFFSDHQRRSIRAKVLWSCALAIPVLCCGQACGQNQLRGQNQRERTPHEKTQPAQGADAALALNRGSTTYDHHPSYSPLPSGGGWLAWHSYKDGRDAVIARRLDSAGRLHESQQVNRRGASISPPIIVSDTAHGAWVIWSAKLDGRWRIMQSRRTEEGWSTALSLTPEDRDAIHPAALRLGPGRIQVAWTEFGNSGSRIVTVTIANGQASPPRLISNPQQGRAYRPLLIEHQGQVWAFWDQYARPNYSVYGRRISPKFGEIARVSPEGQYCLTPTAISHRSGLHVAWLQKRDVVGGPGVISQWHTLHAARQDGNHWKLIRNPQGASHAAELTQGLMAQISPKVIATGGYLGARTRPMLHAVDDQVWLFWERKKDHRGSTPRVAGDLIGRPIRNDQWQTPKLIHSGHVDYHLIHQNHLIAAPNSKPSATVKSTAKSKYLPLIASRLPKAAIRTYERLFVPLADAQPFQQDRWAGWNPIVLPIESEQIRRRRLNIDGQEFQLYWADLHCHNNLSADAEGEADELNHYARDRARIDVVAFTNNDFYNVPLTQYEYEVGNLLAEKLSIKDQFLSLAGYEWTSRIPGTSSAALGDSGNWLPPYRNRSYANHRSVIYPNDRGPLIHFTEVGNDIARLNEAVAKAGGITLSQHPTFKLSGHPVEVGLELTSGWSNYIQRNPQLFHRSLEAGRYDASRRLGFVANGDTHRRAPGLSGALTGIYAKDLTAESIINALRNRRCFATAGSKIAIDARANGAFMGQAVKVETKGLRLEITVTGTRPIKTAALIRNGKEIVRIEGNGSRQFHAEHVDRDLPRGTHYYYWRVTQERSAPVLPGNLMTAHGHLAWSSPHWVTAE